MEKYHVDLSQEGRYARHLSLSTVGKEGQERFARARVLIVGVGGLGSPVALYLAAAGIGHLTLVDDDRVSIGNLQRQILYDTPSVGRLKVDVARERLTALNPDCQVTAVAQRLTAKNMQPLVEAHDVVVDCTDNAPTRYALDDACAQACKPLVHAAIGDHEGHLTVFHYGDSPAYRDLFPPSETAPGTNTGTHIPPGVLGTTPGVLGTLQANEVLKLILGLPGILAGRLLIVDLLQGSFTTVTLPTYPRH